MVRRDNKLKNAEALYKVLRKAVGEYMRHGATDDEAIDAAVADMTDYLAAFKLIKRKHDRLVGNTKFNRAHLTAH